MKLAKQDLQDMYYSMSNKGLCKKLGITNATLISLLKRNGIILKGPGNRTDRFKISVTN